jgi:hypothetical protein
LASGLEAAGGLAELACCPAHWCAICQSTPSPLRGLRAARRDKSLLWSDLSEQGHESYARMAGSRVGVLRHPHAQGSGDPQHPHPNPSPQGGGALAQRPTYPSYPRPQSLVPYSSPSTRQSAIMTSDEREDCRGAWVARLPHDADHQPDGRCGVCGACALPTLSIPTPERGLAARCACEKSRRDGEAPVSLPKLPFRGKRLATIALRAGQRQDRSSGAILGEEAMRAALEWQERDRTTRQPQHRRRFRLPNWRWAFRIASPRSPS